MNHQYEYQLTVICDDEDCSDYGIEIYSVSSHDAEIASGDNFRVIKAQEKHEDAEQEYQDFEIRQHQKMPREED